MTLAKEIIGDTTCIMGNVPVGLLLTSAPEKVKEYCKEIIETAGKNGGYIMSAGAVLHEVRTENLQAMFDITREYGLYEN